MLLSWMTSRVTLHPSFRLSGCLLSICPVKAKGNGLHLTLGQHGRDMGLNDMA